MDKVNKQELRRLAEEATPGEWGYDGSYVCTSRNEDGAVYVESWNPVSDCLLTKNAKYIAAANPAAILSLLDELEQKPCPASTDFAHFLAAVMDAAGLVRHGRQSKELSEYLGRKCMEYRAIPLSLPEPLQPCSTCDGTGDVHRADGEWLGECHCMQKHRADVASGDLLAIAEECGGARMASNVVQVTREDLQRIVSFVADERAEAELEQYRKDAESLRGSCKALGEQNKHLTRRVKSLARAVKWLADTGWGVARPKWLTAILAKEGGANG